MLTNTLALAILVSTVALLNARSEYKQRGKLTWFGVFLLCAMLFIPNLVLEYVTSYELPETALDYLGVVIAVVGLAICVASITYFRSISKVFCVDPGELTVSGPYRWSRNPQYVGYFLFLFGFAINDWSTWCLAALVVVAISLHLLVLIEEEHLRRAFGEQYAAFCREIPRYIGW